MTSEPLFVKNVAMDLVKLASWCCFVLQLIKVSLRKKVFVLSSQAEPHETTGQLPNTRFHPCRVFSCGARERCFSEHKGYDMTHKAKTDRLGLGARVHIQ